MLLYDIVSKTDAKSRKEALTFLFKNLMISNSTNFKRDCLVIPALRQCEHREL